MDEGEGAGAKGEGMRDAKNIAGRWGGGGGLGLSRAGRRRRDGPVKRQFRAGCNPFNDDPIYTGTVPAGLFLLCQKISPPACHHPGARPDIRHRARELQISWRMRRHPYLDRPGPLRHHLVQSHLEHLVRPQRPIRQHDAKVEIVRGIGPMAGRAAVYHGRVRAARRMEQQAIRRGSDRRRAQLQWLRGVGAQRQIAPRNQILFVALISVDNCHFNRHPVQVNHAPQLTRQPAGRHPLILSVDEIVEVPVGLAHHADAIAFGQFVKVKLAVFAAGALAVGENARPRHHGSAVTQVCHCGGKVQQARIVRGHSHLE
jgi:hypothetical protein